MSAPTISVAGFQYLADDEGAEVGWQAEVSINGSGGRVEFNRFGLSLYGAWASHTGYRSDYTLRPESDLEAEQQLRAWLEPVLTEYWQKNTALPFVVAKEHREHGWKDITWWGHGESPGWDVKLPGWHAGVVASAAVEAGATLTESMGHPVLHFDGEWEEGRIRHLLSPILRDGTRLADEGPMADEIRALSESIIGQQMGLFG